MELLLMLRFALAAVLLVLIPVIAAKSVPCSYDICRQAPNNSKVECYRTNEAVDCIGDNASREMRWIRFHWANEE